MKTIKLILLSGLMMLTSSCMDWYCHNRNDGNVELLPVHKKSVPYKKGDVCNFVDKSGQIVRFVVAEKKNNWKQENEDHSGGGFIDCSDYFLFEEDLITLRPEPNNSEISEISLCLSIDNEYDDNWNLRWDNNICRTDIKILYSNNWYNFRFRYNQNGEFLIDDKVIFHKTMAINNKIYEDVVENNGMFYNQTFGILKVTQGKIDILTINR